MGCTCSKLCCDRKKDYKKGKDHTNGNICQPEEPDPSAKVLTNADICQPEEPDPSAKVLTNSGSTSDKVTEPEDSDKINKDKKAEVTTQKPSTPPKNENRSTHKKKKRKKHVDSSSDSDTTSSSSSSSDSDAPRVVEKKSKTRNKDGGITKVYSKTTFGSGTKITINKGKNITINDNKTIIKKNPPSRKTETRKLFTQKYNPEMARVAQKELFNQLPMTGPNGDGCFIDLTKYALVEEVKALKLLGIWTDSVGIVRTPRGTCTCFRVGSCYIMTALHGIIDFVKPEVQPLDAGSREIDWRANLHVLSNNDYFVDFKYLKDGPHHEENKFFFKLVPDINSVPFYDESTDSIILELLPNRNSPLPPPFRKFGLPLLDKKFHLVHHAHGKAKKTEPVDKVVDKDAESARKDIRTLQTLSEDFLRMNGKNPDLFKCEIPPYDTLVNRDRLLIHCASNKGASGGPGIQITSDDQVVVVTMLLHGYPDWYYAERCADVKPNWNKAYTVEQGVNIASIYFQMCTRNPHLFADIFCNPISRTVQAVPPQP